MRGPARMDRLGHHVEVAFPTFECYKLKDRDTRGLETANTAQRSFLAVDKIRCSWISGRILSMPIVLHRRESGDSGLGNQMGVSSEGKAEEVCSPTSSNANHCCGSARRLCRLGHFRSLPNRGLGGRGVSFASHGREGHLCGPSPFVRRFPWPRISRFLGRESTPGQPREYLQR
jgi:hypothetical protein